MDINAQARRFLGAVVSPLLIAFVTSGCVATSVNDSNWDRATQSRIRVFHGTAAYLHLGDVCDGSKHPVIHAAAGGFSYLVPNKRIGMPATRDMPFSYSEYVIPANKPLTVEMYWQAQNASRAWEHCGPLYVTFSPEPGHDYDTAMRFENGVCQGIAVRKFTVGADGKIEPKSASLSGLPFHQCR